MARYKKSWKPAAPHRPPAFFVTAFKIMVRAQFLAIMLYAG
ncbi:hypothetical protein [Lacrimispora celerecrescens]|nr:hypothetical protein [Lacrimispora celerecrescens]